ncbi:MAG: DUF2812 domain-containing protein [Clostridia bacterium]|nr:DUF2812 domain-containing protein [Clostridia bacterium]
MEIKINKLYFAWQEDKEIEFLEQRAAEGLFLTRAGFGVYWFKQGEPRKVSYQLDFKGFNNRISESEYLQLYEDSGWEKAATFGSWYYFMKEKTQEPDESIFNDNHSKKVKYRRLLFFLLLTGFPLYYQAILYYPLVDRDALVFPSFYSIFRVIVGVLVIIHFFALIKIASIYLKTGKDIKE